MTSSIFYEETMINIINNEMFRLLLIKKHENMKNFVAYFLMFNNKLSLLHTLSCAKLLKIVPN